MSLKPLIDTGTRSGWTEWIWNRFGSIDRDMATLERVLMEERTKKFSNPKRI